MKIWNKKMTDLTVGETCKASIAVGIISMVLAVVPFGIAAVIEGSGKNVPDPDIPDLDVEEEDEEE